MKNAEIINCNRDVLHYFIDNKCIMMKMSEILEIATMVIHQSL